MHSAARMNRGESRSTISRPAEIECSQRAFSGEGLNGKLQDCRDHGAQHVGAFVGEASRFQSAIRRPLPRSRISSRLTRGGLLFASTNSPIGRPVTSDWMRLDPQPQYIRARRQKKCQGVEALLQERNELLERAGRPRS